MFTVKSLVAIATVGMLCLAPAASSSVIPSPDGLNLNSTPRKYNNMEGFNDDAFKYSQAEDGIKDRRSATDKGNLSFCPSPDLNKDCTTQAVQLSGAPSACFTMPLGFLKQGQSMHLNGFSCRVFQNPVCDERDTYTSRYFMGVVSIKDGSWRFQSYQCKTGSP